MTDKEDIRRRVRHKATQFLARREHGYQELIQKLCATGLSADITELVVREFRQADLQSDLRFTEMHIRHAFHKGKGLQYVREKMRSLDVDKSLVDTINRELEFDWYALASEVRHKKFGETLPNEMSDKAKQQRFLIYRGFSVDEIQHALTNNPDP